MATTLRHGREHVSMAEAAPPKRCPKCGAEMNHHAEKVLQTAGPADELPVEEMYACPACGTKASRSSAGT
jgi:uncharacterized protein with PIN domain